MRNTEALVCALMAIAAVRAPGQDSPSPRAGSEACHACHEDISNAFAKNPQAPDELRALESFVFPWIERRAREEIAAARADGRTRLVVLDAAVMLEAGWNNVCDRVVYVDACRGYSQSGETDGCGR